MPVLSSSAGAIVGAAINYSLNYRFTFMSKDAHLHAFPKYLVVTAISFLINAGIMDICTNMLNIQYFVSQMIATSIVLIWNFCGNKIWTFRREYVGS